MATMMNGKYPVIDICSDIHFFHRNVSTQHIVETMESFYPPSYLAKLDTIIISGDLFDRTILFSDEDTRRFVSWAVSFLSLIKHYNIELIVIEGTPSHDRLQSAWLVTLNDSYEIGADVHYFKGINIYKSSKSNKTYLLIQDELTTDVNETYQLAVKIIRDNGLDKVDIIVMHGMLDFNMPSDILIDHAHKTDLYLELVNDFLTAGHIHKSCFYKNAYVPGSATRLRHGEPEDKGHVNITFTSEHTHKATFLVNDKAMVFRELDLRGVELVDGNIPAYLTKLDEPIGSFIRLVCDRETTHLFPTSYFSEVRPEYVWSKKVSKKGDDNKVTYQPLDIKEVVSITIGRDNVTDIINKRLMSKYEPEVVAGCITLLEGVV